MIKKQFLKGKYYIGDPCYVVNDENWDQLLDDTDYFGNEEQYFKGYEIAVGDTAYGDGTYVDNYGNEYGVDAGVIGIMPVAAMDERYEIVQVEKLGNFFEFEEDFMVEIDDGVFKFGHVTIDTNDSDSNDEFSWW